MKKLLLAASLLLSGAAFADTTLSLPSIGFNPAQGATTAPAPLHRRPYPGAPGRCGDRCCSTAWCSRRPGRGPSAEPA